MKEEYSMEIKVNKDFDERSMIIEQDRLAREKKKKKNRKKKRIAGGVVLILAVFGIWYLGWGRNLAVEEEETIVQVTASAGQEIIFARLDSVKGNEISYTIAAELEESVNTEAEDASAEDMPAGEGMTGGNEGGRRSGTGEMPDRSEMSGTGGMPDRSEMSGTGGMPDRSEMSGIGGMSDMSAMFSGSTATSDDTFTYNSVTYQLTEETATVMIPVGTEVTTRLGTVTTFSRLKSGDCIALVIERDGENQMITAVYIVG